MNGSVVRRSRWLAAGASLAFVVGAGGVLTSSAEAPATTSSFVPMTPCRLADTRPAPDNVGTRSAAVGPGDTFVAQVTGSNGNCVIPASATGVSMNVAIVSPSAASFLTVFPSDQSRPVAASLNWVANQAPTPNAVTAALSADGKLSFYNLAGTVHLAIDVVGYYVPSTAGPAGPAGPTGPVGPAGPAGPAGTARAYGHVTYNPGRTIPAVSTTKNVVSVSLLATGLLCIELAPSVSSVSAVVTVSMDYSGDDTNTNKLSFAEISGTCGANGVAIVSYLYNLGATAQFPTNEPFYFIVG